ncbi:MAG: DNA topoisomerase IV subunit A [Deltaproteobacteria bacterium]|nr:MAG: DNA topoisomerase IV subunit A [Deltaproteobacteria bacterium]
MTTKKRTPPAPARRANRPPAPPPPAAAGGGGGGGDLDASLMEETRRRYLNYALSVITSRALPDVRDGLKPVQRRILYAMFADEHLVPDAKHRKSAKVVGAVIGRYHPHGDTAVYDAMVRMAQDFAMRMPLVDGSGNFGSVDGDGAAAYRYTECRLAPPAMELLRELRQNTVPFRPNFDGTTTEPVVLPARLPNLLVNGSTGIAVGMATNIPPHNLREVTKALVALADNRDLTTTNLLKYIQGPDFPTGGEILTSKVELRQIYEAGQGAIRVRATYTTEKRRGGGVDIVITSIPYGVNKSTVVERIAETIIKRKVPQLNDVRDESTTDVRIVLELKKGADPDMVMAYLFKNTPLQLNFNVNFTCLVPTENPEVGRPERLGIKALLEHFLDFRFATIKRRFEHELEALRKRIHILEGFVVIFDALDEAIRIIRRSDGKKDAAAKLMQRFDLDADQTDAILELKLYKLAKLEIDAIRAELREKTAEAARIEAILRSERRLWKVVKDELVEVADTYGTKRITRVGASAEDLPEVDETAFIVDEDTHVVLTRDGWLKRLREIKDLSKLRTREGDVVVAVLPGSTREHVVFFSNFGSAYVTKINDIPATTGYGDPAQKLFKFRDGERIVAALTLDPRAMVPDTLLAISKQGYGMRFSIDPLREATTRAGRRYARPAQGDEIVGVTPVSEGDTVIAATAKGHVLLCPAAEINQLENPGKGVRVIKVAPDDELIAFVASSGRDNPLRVQTVPGKKKFEIAPDKRRLSSRGGKGQQIVKRSRLEPTYVPPTIPRLATVDAPKGVQ